MRNPPRRKLWTALFLGLLTWHGAVLSINIARGWTNHHDWNGFLWSQAAHNHLRAGLRNTLGASAWNYFGPPPIPPEAYYVHHPPLLSLILAAMFAVLGEHEWVARLLPVTFSLMSAVLLWLLVREAAARRAATLAVAVFAACPMELYFGQMVNFEALMVVWMLGALCCLRRWQLTTSGAYLAAMVCFVALGLWTEWPMYILAVVLAATLLTRRPPDWRAAGLLIAIALASAMLFLLHIRLVRPDAWRDALGQFTFRLSADSALTRASGGTFTATEWFLRQGRFLTRGILWPLWILALGGAVVCWRKRLASDGLRWLGWAALSLFSMQAIYLAVWRNVSYTHEYASFYFVLPVAIMGGVALDGLLSWVQQRWSSKLPRAVAHCLLVATIVGLCGWGYAQSRVYHQRYYLLEWGGPEPEDLIPSLGRTIARAFPDDAMIICNFPWISPQLQYYARKEMAFQKTVYVDWQPYLATNRTIDGVIWQEAQGAAELLAALPPGHREVVHFGPYSFCLWRPEFTGTGTSHARSIAPSTMFESKYSSAICRASRQCRS